MASKPRVAVVGASGNVGRQMLEILHQRRFAAELAAVASARSAGEKVAYGDDELTVKDLADFDFKGWDIILASAGGRAAAEFAPEAAAAGAVVIDNSSHFRMDEAVPLVVPEVNPQALKGWDNKRIVANPNCSTIQLAVALQPLHLAAKVKRVVAATYQSTSGAGKRAMDELFNQSKDFLADKPLQAEEFAVPIAFNLIPRIDDFMPDGSTKEEWKMIHESKKIFADDDLKIAVTCVRVPTFISHGIAVHLETEKPLTAAQARSLLAKAPGVAVIDERVPKGYITPIDAVGKDMVYVSRIREDELLGGIALWVVADNLRKGAALNAVQVAELLVRDYL